MTDEQAIRDLITTWFRATAEGDLTTLGHLMAEDVVFLRAGEPPLRGRGAFMDASREAFKYIQIEASGEIQEIQISGEWAYCWNHLNVNATHRESGRIVRRTGPTLSILRKGSDGAWVIVRDANLLTVAPSADA
jgi:uncharacterized protein (TIGR02246 family)